MNRPVTTIQEDADHPDTIILLQSIPRYDLQVERWWSTRSKTYHVSVVLKDPHPSTEIVLTAEEATLLQAMLAVAIEKAKELAALSDAEQQPEKAASQDAPASDTPESDEEEDEEQ